MFEGDPITIDGIEIPSDAPLFLTLIAIHVFAGLTCVISGVFAMLSKKQRGVHTKAGKIYFGFLWVVFVTATIVAMVRWEHDYHLFLLGVGSFAAAFIGRKAAIKKWRKWSIIHVVGMASSYILLIIAFYVDNGRFLPLWKDIHPAFYWILPVVIGIPLTLWSLMTNPLTQEYFKKKNPF
jgi:hypothetical protein